jgi:plastocyanin
MRNDWNIRRISSLLRMTLVVLTVLGVALPSIAAAKTVEVKMTDTPARFAPEKVAIKVGDTVEWNNNAASLHSVTTNKSVAQNPSDVSSPPAAKPFDSGFMPPGAKWSYTFTVPGTYKYLCLPHEKDGMVGYVVVTK